MRNKIISIVLCCAVLGALSACGSVENEEAEASESTVEEEVLAESDDVEEAEAPVVYEDDLIKVTFLDLFEEPELEGMAYLQFEIENKTDEEITVYPMDSYVKDIQITIGSGVPTKMDVGKKSRNAFSMNISYIGIESVEDIESIELKFWVVDDDLETLEETGTFFVPL